MGMEMKYEGRGKKDKWRRCLTEEEEEGAGNTYGERKEDGMGMSR